MRRRVLALEEGRLSQAVTEGARAGQQLKDLREEMRKDSANRFSEAMTEMLHVLGIDVPGAKQVFYGVCLLVVVLALPDGIWPWLARRLRLERS